MTKGLNLRDYQTETIAAVRERWAAGVRRVAAVLPTGAGKTVVFAHLAAQMRQAGVRTVVLAHRDELIEQAAHKLDSVDAGLSVGVWKAQRREAEGCDVVVASVQSLARRERRDELLAAGPWRMVIVDEAHHAVANTYMHVLEDLGCFADGDLSHGAVALGVTATLSRADRLGLDQVWQEVAYRRDIIEMIREGWLVNAKGIRVWIDDLDLSQVPRSRGEWRDGALSRALHDALAPQAIARAYGEHAKDRPGVLFAPTVELAHEMAEVLTAAGIPAAGIDGAMSMHDRRDVLARYSRGDVQVVCNCMVLTEGWDAPWTSAAVIARPTSSASLYVQMAGRALRPYPGKADALILDVAGVTGRHRLACVADLAGAERPRQLSEDLLEYEHLDLLEFSAQEESGAGSWPLPAGRDGRLAHEVVDLFGTRRQAWLRTKRGVWFLSNGDDLVFLAPERDVGRYAVCRTSMKSSSGGWIKRDVDLDMAMSWGEQEATNVLTRKGAKWRKLEPTQGQLNAAERMNLQVDGLSRGELSDLMTVTFASRRIDKMPLVATVGAKGYW